MKRFCLILVVLMALLLSACAAQTTFEYLDQSFEVDWEQKQVCDENYTYQFKTSNQQGDQIITVRYPNGEEVTRRFFNDNAWTDDVQDPSIEGYATMDALTTVIREAEIANQSATGRKINVPMIFGGVLLLVVGLVFVAVPETAWKIKEGWKYDGGVEPSSFLLKLYTTVGMIAVIGGIAIIIGGIAGAS